jgi:hypothetical protein
MIAINVKHDLDQLKAKVERVYRDQIPFATSLAINATARKAKDKMPGVLERLLDRPKPFTTRSGFFVTNSSKTNLSATVGLKDKQAEYLAPLLAGQVRKIKASEQKFLGRYFVPTKNAPVDGYGNVSKTNLLAILRAATATDAEWKGKRIVVLAKPAGRLPAGVYAANKRRGTKTATRGLTALLLFVGRAPSYRRRIRLADEINQVVRAEFATDFAAAMARAAGSAR